VKSRIAFVLSLVMSLPLFAQTENVVAKFDNAGNPVDSIMFQGTGTSAGNIGIGTTAPANTLHLVKADGSSNVPLKLETTGADSITGFSLKNDARNWHIRVDGTDGDKFKIWDSTVPAYRLTIDDAGRIGIGTTSPTMSVHLVEATDTATTFEAQNTNATGLNASAVFRTRADAAVTSYISHGSARTSPTRFGNVVGGWSEILTFGGNGLMIGTNHGAPLILGTSATSRMHFTPAGDVGIGTSSPSAKLHVIGNIVASGSISGATVIGAIYQDLAEWVPATSDMTPGTVVVLNLDKTNEVMPSSRAYDTAVAGVVSAAPGIILGVAGDAKEQIATTGRVKVRVDARTTPVVVGDLLVTSTTPGMAMRSEPMQIAGQSFHKPGTIIGKALEPLEGGVGEILVLLSMQ